MLWYNRSFTISEFHVENTYFFQGCNDAANKSSVSNFNSIMIDTQIYDLEEDSLNEFIVKKSRPHTKTNSWVDIFARCQLVISTSNSNHISEQSNIMINFFDESFASTFGFDLVMFDESLPFDVLARSATRKERLVSLQRNLLTGQPTTEFINLYKKNGIPLSCHVTLQPITRSYKKSNRLLNAELAQRSWAVMVIRSASVVGNASCFGIGFYNICRTPESIKNDVLKILFSEAAHGKKKRQREE